MLIKMSWCQSKNFYFRFLNNFIDCLTSQCRSKHLKSHSNIYATNIYVTPDYTSSPLSLFTDSQEKISELKKRYFNQEGICESTDIVHIITLP